MGPLHEDWTQVHLYGGPLWGDTFEGLAQRISAAAHHGGLLLLDEDDVAELPHLLRFLRIGDERGYEVTRTTAERPLTDGYLTCLRFEPSTEVREVGLAAAMTAFVAAELAAGAGLEACLADASYLDEPAGGPLWLVGYPAFDTGPLRVTFALLAAPTAGRGADQDRPQWTGRGAPPWTYHLWSRITWHPATP